VLCCLCESVVRRLLRASGKRPMEREEVGTVNWSWSDIERGRTDWLRELTVPRSHPRLLVETLPRIGWISKPPSMPT
jgi:hypothetical protein